MNYGAESWGENEWSALELAGKYILGVPQSTPTGGIYAELGRHPIFILQKISIVKYLKCLTELPDGRQAKKAYRQLTQDDDDGQYNWLSFADTIMDEYTLDIADSVEATKSKLISSFNNILRQRLADCIDQRKKLRTYATFKTDIRFENYLDFMVNFKVRQSV